MGRRRRKVIRLPKKRLPRFFSCPTCGKEAVKVEIFRDKGRAVVNCGSCNSDGEFRVVPAQNEVDINCTFVDIVYKRSSKGVTNQDSRGQGIK